MTRTKNINLIINKNFSFDKNVSFNKRLLFHRQKSCEFIDIVLNLKKSILFIIFILLLKNLFYLSYLSYNWEIYLIYHIYHIIEKSILFILFIILLRSLFQMRVIIQFYQFIRNLLLTSNLKYSYMHHASSITIHCQNFNNNLYKWATCFSEISIRMMKTKIENENKKKWSMLFIKFLIKKSIKKSIDISINFIFVFNRSKITNVFIHFFD